MKKKKPEVIRAFFQNNEYEKICINFNSHNLLFFFRPLMSQNVIEEIVVTSMKRNTLLKDTPASISTMESEEINLKGILSPQEIKFQVPSMSYTSIFGEPYITIRGVSGFNNAPGVSVSIDGVYQSKSTSSILGEVDLDRIEVIRGHREHCTEEIQMEVLSTTSLQIQQRQKKVSSKRLCFIRSSRDRIRL